MAAVELKASTSYQFCNLKSDKNSETILSFLYYFINLTASGLLPTVNFVILTSDFNSATAKTYGPIILSFLYSIVNLACILQLPTANFFILILDLNLATAKTYGEIIILSLLYSSAILQQVDSCQLLTLSF